MALPEPDLTGAISLEQTLALRRSIRAYTDRSLTSEEIGQLLWAAQGITRDWGGRTAPSAGALYPLEIYTVSRDGVGHYLPAGHRLELLSSADLRPALTTAALSQEPVSDAPVVFVITAVFSRVEQKYDERGIRYVHLEAGHAAQNLLLQAVALDLGAVVIGAFDDSEVKRVLGLPTDHDPLYLIPTGHPDE
jgi:SagB-type dehydrogenase family enzyme